MLLSCGNLTASFDRKKGSAFSFGVGLHARCLVVGLGFKVTHGVEGLNAQWNNIFHTLFCNALKETRVSDSNLLVYCFLLLKRFQEWISDRALHFLGRFRSCVDQFPEVYLVVWIGDWASHAA